MPVIKVEAYKCERCGHIWLPRVRDKEAKKRPVACAKCKSAYWDTPRKK